MCIYFLKPNSAIIKKYPSRHPLQWLLARIAYRVPRKAHILHFMDTPALNPLFIFLLRLMVALDMEQEDQYWSA